MGLFTLTIGPGTVKITLAGIHETYNGITASSGRYFYLVFTDEDLALHDNHSTSYTECGPEFEATVVVIDSLAHAWFQPCSCNPWRLPEAELSFQRQLCGSVQPRGLPRVYGSH